MASLTLYFVLFWIMALIGEFGKSVNAIETSCPVPVVEVDVARINDTNVLQFYCDINATADSHQQYVVEWSLHTSYTHNTTLYIHKPCSYHNKTDFRQHTALTETHLKQNGINNPGFTIFCSVQTQPNNSLPICDPQRSALRFFGLQVVNNSDSILRVRDGESITIYFKLTVPFGCLRQGCFMDFIVYIPKQATDCNISRLMPFDRKSVPCGVRFSKDDVLNGTLKPFSVNVNFSKSASDAPVKAYELELATHSINHDHPFFSNYLAAAIKIVPEILQKNVQSNRCVERHTFYSNGSMSTFNGKQIVFSREGTFILYKNKQVEVEVQGRISNCAFSWLCIRDVAIRAGRDLFIIKDIPFPAKISPTMVLCDDGLLNISSNNPTAYYKVHLPSDTVVSIYTAISYSWGSTVLINASWADLNNSEGLCGSFDLDSENNLDARNISLAVNNMDSWMVSHSEDLFEQDNYLHLKSWREERYLCACERDQSLGYGELSSRATCDPSSRILCHYDLANPGAVHDSCD